MNILTTRKIVFGILMSLVLAFSVQGIAEALIITQTSSPDVSKPSGSSFELTFTVTLSSPKDVNSFNTNNSHKKGNTADIAYAAGSNTRSNVSVSRTVDAGYAAGDTHYYTTAAVDTSTVSGLAITTNTRNWGISGTDDGELPTGQTWRSSNSTDRQYAAGSKIRSNVSVIRIVDSTGYAAGDTHYYTTAAVDTSTVSGLAITTNTRNWGTESEAYYYNDEAIEFFITRPDGGSGILKLTNPSYVLPGRADDESGATTANVTSSSLQEMMDIGLPRTLNLVYEGASIGKHTIKVWDATPLADFPPDAVPSPNRPRNSKTFTIYVTPSTITTVPDADDITPDDRRIPVVVDEPQQVNALFTFPGTESEPGNYRIHYEVFRGNGILYVGTREQEFKTPPPGQTLLVHQASNVWIKMNGTSNEVHLSFAGENRSTARARVIYEYRGKDLPGRNTSDTAGNTAGNTVNNTISVSPSSISGAPGTTSDITVTAGSATVRVAGSSGFTSAGGTVSGTGSVRTITLPNTAGDYILTASASGYLDRTISVTVAAPLPPGTLTITTVGARVGNQQGVRITAQRGGSPPSSALTVRLSGITLPPTATIPAGQSSTVFTATLPSATAATILTASATDYNPVTFTIPAPGQQTTTPGTTPTTPTGPAGAADSIEIDGSRQFTRNVNQATSLRVRVVDINDRGVSNVRVTFRILAPGQGRLSQRGNGRAVQVNTDRNGYASASLTPLGGDVIVEAKAAGVSASVTFIIDVSGATTTPTTPTPSTDVPSSQMINPEDADVHVGAANRPPMLWVDGGAIYALVGADVQRFAPSVDNALNIAVGGGKVYWTEKMGESGGTINSANLNGSGVTELASIFATPIGIAVDTAGSKLYWTNAAGRIQSANLDGSRITNVLQNLSGLKDIAVSRGNLYWTQYDATAGTGSVGIGNSTGRGTPKYISTGSDTPGSLAIANGNVYWTEMTGDSGGTVNSANLNGSGATQLAAIRAAPNGIAVDTARSKLYWTNDRGRIQSANLDGSRIQNVVDGLGSPGDMVLSNSITAPAATTTTTTTTTADNSKYDVNGDGKVDNTDASLVAAAMNTSNARYDVNGDGTVNFLDLLLVFDNRDAGAASAPTVLGMQLSAIQRDVLQEQIDLLIATGDRSPAAMRTLIYLQQLIATARPEQTQLLANYPNPFNPETWIPYELATDTEVRLTIYNTHGVVIRTLQLGHQSAGYYVGRDRAAYWDGRNAYGEQVASGIYFYQLETDAMSSMRKMVILK